MDAQKPRREMPRRERAEVSVHNAAAVEIRLGKMHDALLRRGRNLHEGFLVREADVGAEAFAARLGGFLELGGEVLHAGFAEVGEGGVGFGGGFEGGEEGVVVAVGGGHGGWWLWGWGWGWEEGAGVWLPLAGDLFVLVR